MRQRNDHGVDLSEKLTCVTQNSLVLLLHSALPDNFVDELDSRIIRLFIPSFYYQMTPKIPLNTRCSISISKNLSINGRTRSSDQLGIWSYNINP